MAKDKAITVRFDSAILDVVDQMARAAGPMGMKVDRTTLIHMALYQMAQRMDDEQGTNFMDAIVDASPE